LFVLSGAIIIYRFHFNKELDRYCSYLNKSAMFGGRTTELEKPELVGSTDMKYIQFQSDLNKIIKDGTKWIERWVALIEMEISGRVVK